MVSTTRHLVGTNRGLYVRLPQDFVSENSLKARQIVHLSFSSERMQLEIIGKNKNLAGCENNHELSFNDTIGSGEEHGNHINR